MSDVSLKLTAFEGPLDLLMHLCSCLVCSVFEDFSDVFRLHDHFCDSVSLVDNDFRAYALFHVGAEGEIGRAHV